MDDLAWKELGNALPRGFFSYIVFEKYLIYLDISKSHWESFEKFKYLSEEHSSQ